MTSLSFLINDENRSIPAVLVLTRKKSVLKSVRYVNMRLGKEAFAYPLAAYDELKRLSNIHRAIQVLRVELPVIKCDRENVRFLASKKITLKLPDSNELYSTNLYDEFITLSKWYEHGIAAGELDEYHHRFDVLRSYLMEYQEYLFDTALKSNINRFIRVGSSVKTSLVSYEQRRSNLLPYHRNAFVEFKDRVIKLLRKPRELADIVSQTKVNPSNARRWLAKMETMGIIVKSRKRGRVGRPKNVYYLSSALPLEDEDFEDSEFESPMSSTMKS